MAALGMPPGRYQLANRDVDVVDEAGTLAARRTHDRGLAGSVISMDQAVRNLATFAEIDPALAARAATSVPAALLGVGPGPDRLATES